MTLFSRSPLDAMQSAVDIVTSSPHETNKISAALFNDDSIVARTNHWPQRIAETIGTGTRIGSSSGTVHAEVYCLLDFPQGTDHASLCVTDPFCPNCAKNIAEAGIRRIYIDHKGFTKDFATRRGTEFSNMSLRIAARAGISIYEVRRREGLIVPILEIPEDYRAPQDNPIKIEPVTTGLSSSAMHLLAASVKVKADRWGCAYAQDRQGQLFSLVASVHAAIGYSEKSADDAAALSHPEGKYNFYLEPMNRLMMGAVRKGLKLVDGYVYASCIPTSREQVNLVAAGLTHLYAGDVGSARDADSFSASALLAGAGVLKFQTL